MPREKKYTPKQLREAINAYFKSITYTQSAQKLVDTGRVNKNGMPVLKYEDCVNDLGEVIQERIYAVPPSIEGLCIHLGVSRQTLHNWRSDAKSGEKYSDIIDAAKLRIEAYLHEALNKRSKVAGIIFDLQCNYGWGADKKDSGAERCEVSFIPLPDGTGGSGDYDE